MTRPVPGTLIPVGREPNNGNMIIEPGVSNKPIPEGWHEGQGYVKGDANLVAANIAAGVEIFGVEGEMVAGLEMKTGRTNTEADKMTLTVDGLGFEPLIVFIFYTTSDYHQYMKVFNSYNVSKDAISALDIRFSTSPVALSGTKISVTEDGFTTKFYAEAEDGYDGSSYADWWAFG